MKVTANGLVPKKEEAWKEHPTYLMAKARRKGFSSSSVAAMREYQLLYNLIQNRRDQLTQEAISTVPNFSSNLLNQL